MQELFVRRQVCSGVRRGFLFYQLSELSCGREMQIGNKNNQFGKSFLFMWTTGRGKRAAGTKSRSSKSGAVQGGDCFKSFPPALVGYSSNLSASEQRL